MTALSLRLGLCVLAALSAASALCAQGRHIPAPPTVGAGEGAVVLGAPHEELGFSGPARAACHNGVPTLEFAPPEGGGSFRLEFHKTRMHQEGYMNDGASRPPVGEWALGGSQVDWGLVGTLRAKTANRRVVLQDLKMVDPGSVVVRLDAAPDGLLSGTVAGSAYFLYKSFTAPPLPFAAAFRVHWPDDWTPLCS